MKFMKCLAVIAAALLLFLASCTDGEAGKTTEHNREIECRITASDIKKSDVLDSVTLTGDEAEALLAYFTYSEYYDPLETIGSPRSFTVSFFCYDENGVPVPMYDSDGVLNEYFVQDTGAVYSNSQYLGNLPDAYEKLFGYVIEKGSTGGYFCNIYQSQTGQTMIRASGDLVREIYHFIAEGAYRMDIDRTDIEKEYINLSFWGAENANFYIYSDDYVEKFDSGSATDLFQPLGTLEGVYQKARDTLRFTLNTKTEAEYEAGNKLNSVIISGPGERSYSVLDFREVDCIFVEDISVSPEDFYMYALYFENCTPQELEEKVIALQSRGDLDIVGKITVFNPNSAYD